MYHQFFGPRRQRSMLPTALAFVLVNACDCSERLIPVREPPPTRIIDRRDAGTTTSPAEDPDAGQLIVDAGTVNDRDAGVVEVRDAGPEPVVDAGVAERPDAGVFSPPPDEVPVYEGPCGPVEIAPGYPAELWGDFQSVPGSGYQETVTLTFPCPVRSVTVTIFDPDYAENEMVAYGDNDVILDRVLFIGDQTPTVLTSSTKTVVTQGAPIVEVLLHPDPLDFVSYGDISYTAY